MAAALDPQLTAAETIAMLRQADIAFPPGLDQALTVEPQPRRDRIRSLRDLCSRAVRDYAARELGQVYARSWTAIVSRTQLDLAVTARMTLESMLHEQWGPEGLYFQHWLRWVGGD